MRLEVVLTVHDEVVAEADEDAEGALDWLNAVLATVPDWAEGLPLKAAGYEAKHYRKE